MYKNRRRGRAGWENMAALAIIVIGSPLMAPVAMAEVTDFSAFSNARQLSDGELDQMRGRFVDRGKILYFGVQMSSMWQNSGGRHLYDHLAAGITLQGDLTGGMPRVSFEPHVTMVSVGDGVTGNIAGMGVPSNGAIVRDAGTGNARGVVQTIQAGGDFNTAANDLQIDVMDASRYRSLAGNTGASASHEQLLSGTRISAQYGSHGMNVEIDVPGMGRAMQAIVPNQGLRQSIQLTSDFQQVHNVTRLQLYMGQQGVNANVPGVRSAMESARRLNR